MEESHELERFWAAFEYYFTHIYGPSFPRDLVMHNLWANVRPLFVRCKRLVENKQQTTIKRGLSLWETYQEYCPYITKKGSNGRSASKSINNPIVQNLFLAYDEIANYDEDLPPSEMESSSSDLPVKIVNIFKGKEPLGATIKVFSNGDICVARVISGGAADRSGSIHPGDLILEINNIPVSYKSPDEVLDIVNKSEDGTVMFKLVPNKEIESKPTKTTVRAMFDYMGSADDYQPCKEAALSFQNGDILEVIVSEDAYWQQASVIGHGSLITAPLAEFEDATASEMSMMSSVQQRLPVGLIPTEAVMRQIHRYNADLLPCYYEPVASFLPGEVRPVVLIGAPCIGRRTLKRSVIASNPFKYVAPVPHTSRPPRPNERNGVDYFFVSRSEMEQWIAAGHFVEYGELNNNLYGTMDHVVFQIMRQGKVPVISAHPLSLRIIRSALFKPIIVFIEPPHFSLFKQTRLELRAKSSLSPQGTHLSDQDLANVISYSAQMDAMYSRFTDFRIVNGVLEDAVAELVRVLRDFETLPSWIPADWLNSKGFKNSVC